MTRLSPSTAVAATAARSRSPEATSHSRAGASGSALEAVALSVSLSLALCFLAGCGTITTPGGDPFSTHSRVEVLCEYAPFDTVRVRAYSRDAPWGPPRSRSPISEQSSAVHRAARSASTPSGERHAPPPCSHAHAYVSAPASPSGSYESSPSSAMTPSSPAERPPPEISATRSERSERNLNSTVSMKLKSPLSQYSSLAV
mmetsp:Transcript_38492/g.121791  ORF Transcript_38492/g.121791 Transcript_38492/m.121791 type:complete len:201 (+) Transcript_38492:5871-6473(+)